MDLNKEIIEFYNTSDFNNLNDYYQKENIFTILKKERNETTHSAFLAWLLNPQSNHGLKDYALRKLLRLYATSKKAETLLGDWRSNLLLGDYTLDNVEVTTEKSTKTDIGDSDKKGVKEKGGRMDVYIEANINDSDLEERPLKICIENKIYSSEHDRQTKIYHEYLTKNKDISDPLLVEIFLAPKENNKVEAETFVPITYKQLLCHVIEPLLKLNGLNASAALYIEDYIRVLGRPTLGNDEDEKGNSKKANQYSLLALSNAEEEKLKSICESPLYRMAYCVANSNENKLKEWGLHEADIDDNKQLLSDFWESNLNLFEAVALCNGLDLDVSQGESNRDTTKYIVKLYNKDLNFKNKNGAIRKASKSECSLLIFKAWCMWYENQNHTKPSFEDICKAFPISINTYYSHKKWFDNLFCQLDENNNVYYNNNQYKGKIANNKSNKWDFFEADEEHTLILSDCRCLSLKLWRKDSFNKLLERVDKNLKRVDNKLKDFSEHLYITEA